MILEVVVVAATLGSGVFVLRSAGLRGWGLVPLGIVVGASLVAFVGTVQVALRLPTSPVLTYSTVAVVPALWWARELLAGRDVRLSARAAAVTLSSLLPIVWFFRGANLARVNPDSFHLVVSGSLMWSGELGTMPPERFEVWQVSMGALHGVANLQSESYLRAATPLLALATVGSLVWLIERAISTAVGGTGWWVAGIGGLLLITNQRFLYNLFYLNRHAFVAATLLISAAVVWALVHDWHLAPPPVLLVLLATTMTGLALSRGETPIIAGLVLIPLLSSDRVARPHRAALLAFLGATLLMWNASLAFRYLGAGQVVSSSAAGMSLLGAAMVLGAAIIMFGWAWRDPLPRWLPLAIEVVLWGAVLGVTAMEPRLVFDSARSTLHNVALGEGGWGSSLLVLAALTVLVFLATKEGDRLALRFPLTTFVPYAILLAYIRAPGGLPYRPALSDSLNRMLLHLVPLAIFYVATSPTAASWSRAALAILGRESTQQAPTHQAAASASGPAVDATDD